MDIDIATPLVDDEAGGLMSSTTLRWLGAAHFQIEHQGLRLLTDPLYSRLPGDKPHLPVTREDLDRADQVLVTHGHLDHSWDVPWIVSRLDPELHAPAALLGEVHPNPEKHHALERVSGQTFHVGSMAVTPHAIGTEQIGYWFLRSLTIRPIRHRRPQSVPAGLRFLRHHLWGNCFAFHLKFQAEDTTLLFFGNLTSEVAALDNTDRVDILALPYCPANQDWIRDSRFLIDRFRPRVTLVHHYDNFMHPYTLSRYIDLAEFRRAIMDEHPDTRFFLARFYKDVTLQDILNAP